MSISFSYKLAASYSEPRFDSSNQVEFRHLKFSLFPAQVYLVVGDCDISPPWDWTPMMQFVNAFVRVARKLSHDNEALYLFTENQHEIRFRRAGTTLSITTTYSPCTGICDLDEFVSATRRFALSTVRDLRQINPLVGDSSAFAELEAQIFAEPV
jgi:hypothetical protein